MPHEIEAKYRVGSLAPVRDALRAAGAEYVGKLLQTDTFFDSADGSLRSGDRCLRIRTSRPLDDATQAPPPQITYKGPRVATQGAKARLELQTHTEDAAAMAAILEALGWQQRLVLEKRRESYRLDQALVELDELPHIGPFVEIEAPDGETIALTARRLGLEGEGITSSYLGLLDRAREGITARVARITFE